jgi:hypothetical protein
MSQGLIRDVCSISTIVGISEDCSNLTNDEDDSFNVVIFVGAHIL